MESKLFEPQIIYVVLCFLDQRECGKLQYTSKTFDLHLNGLKFRRSLNLRRLHKLHDSSVCITQYLNWVTFRRIKFIEFYGLWNVEALMSTTNIEKFANIILHLANSAELKLSLPHDWYIFFNYLREQRIENHDSRITPKPSTTLRRIDLQNCRHPEIDFGVLVDLFPNLEEFALEIVFNEMFRYSDSESHLRYTVLSLGRLRFLQKLKKIEINGNVNFHLPNSFIHSDILEWRLLLEFSMVNSDLITDDFINELAKCSIKLEVFRVRSCCMITNLSIHLIAQHCKLLRYVQITRCPFCAMNVLYKQIKFVTNNFQLKYDPNTFLLPYNEQRTRDTFPIGCVVTFGYKLVLIVDYRSTYMLK